MRWFEKTDAESYYGGAKSVAAYNRSVTDRRTKHPYQKQEYSEVVKDLEEVGFHIMKDVFSLDQTTSLKAEVDDMIDSRQNLKVDNAHWKVIDQPLFNCTKTAFEIATNKIIKNIASEFFRCTPAIGTLNLRKSLVNDLPEDTTNFFHVDPNSVKFLKFFIYLNDVSCPADGPLTLIEGSHNSKFLGWKNKYRWTEKEIIKIYGEEKMRHMLAKAGDLIVARTTAFHRGTKVTSKDRYMYTINYVIHPEEFKQPSVKVRSEYLNLIQKEDKPLLEVLIKT